MKKALFVLLAFLVLFGFVSCKEEPQIPEGTKENPIVIDNQVALTKTYEWNTGDIVYIEVLGGKDQGDDLYGDFWINETETTLKFDCYIVHKSGTAYPAFGTLGSSDANERSCYLDVAGVYDCLLRLIILEGGTATITVD